MELVRHYGVSIFVEMQNSFPKNSGSKHANAKNPLNSTDQRLDKLLDRAFKAFPHPLMDNPWFATRVVALSRETPQSKISPIQNMVARFSGFGRWLLPLPLIGTSVILLLASHNFHSPETTLVSLPQVTPTLAAPSSSTPSATISHASEEVEFEEHMEMLVSNDQ